MCRKRRKIRRRGGGQRKKRRMKEEEEEEVEGEVVSHLGKTSALTIIPKPSLPILILFA